MLVSLPDLYTVVVAAGGQHTFELRMSPGDGPSGTRVCLELSEHLPLTRRYLNYAINVTACHILAIVIILAVIDCIFVVSVK